MSEKALDVLKEIARMAAKTPDNYVMKVTLPVKSQDDAKALVSELTRSHCICRVEFYGRYYIRCQFNPQALSYLN